MLLLDRMLVGGIQFVLDKVATAADAELRDPDRIREELLAVQEAHELGQISDEELRAAEQALLARLRELQPGAIGVPEGSRVTGVALSVLDEEEP